MVSLSYEVGRVFRAGHDGVVEAFRPLTESEARRFVEVNENGSVEAHFGAAPEARALPFARKTIVAASKVMARIFHGDLSEFLIELGPEYPHIIPAEPVSVQKRLIALVSLMDKEPHKKVEGGEFLQEAFIRKAVSMVKYSQPLEFSSPDDAFIQALSVDGFTFADGQVRRTLPLQVEVTAAESEIDRLLQKYNFRVPKGHLRQAIEAHSRGDWAASNSQLRTFMESLLDEIAVALDSSAASLPGGQQRRQRLATLDFLSRELNEWQDNGQGFLNGLIRRLHPAGSHPGLSDAADCTFRLNIVMLTGQLLLARVEQQAR